MKIKQVEELVGITKKNIRFYEDQGLLEVKRADNGYREYGLEDVKRLQEIRLLRKLATNFGGSDTFFWPPTACAYLCLSVCLSLFLSHTHIEE